MGIFSDALIHPTESECLFKAFEYQNSDILQIISTSVTFVIIVSTVLPNFFLLFNFKQNTIGSQALRTRKHGEHRSYQKINFLHLKA